MPSETGDIASIMAESLELQHTLASLQRQITIGLTRINKVVEMVAKIPGSSCPPLSDQRNLPQGPRPSETPPAKNRYSFETSTDDWQYQKRGRFYLNDLSTKPSGEGTTPERHLSNQSLPSHPSLMVPAALQGNQIPTSYNTSSQQSLQLLKHPPILSHASNPSLNEIKRFSVAIRWDGGDYENSGNDDEIKVPMPIFESSDDLDSRETKKSLGRTKKMAPFVPLVRRQWVNTVATGSIDSADGAPLVRESIAGRISKVFASATRLSQGVVPGRASTSRFASGSPGTSFLDTKNQSQSITATSVPIIDDEAKDVSESFNEKEPVPIPDTSKGKSLSELKYAGKLYNIQPKHVVSIMDAQMIRRHSDDSPSIPQFKPRSLFNQDQSDSQRGSHDSGLTPAFKSKSGENRNGLMESDSRRGSVDSARVSPRATKKPAISRVLEDAESIYGSKNQSLTQLTSRHSAFFNTSTRPSIFVTTESLNTESLNDIVRAKALWDILRVEVTSSSKFVKSLKEKNAAEFLAAAKVQRTISWKRKMNSASVMAIPPLNSDKVNLEPSMEIPSIWHKWCLYRAFDGKGNYIPPELRQTDTKSSTTFLKNGLHPMSVCSTVLSSGMIVIYCVAIFLEPFKAAYNSAIESYSSFSYAISILFLIDTKINLITPLKPRKSDIASQGKRLPLRDWAYQYITSKDMPIDVISMIPWIAILRFPTWSYPLSFLRLFRTYRLRKMVSHNSFCVKIGHSIENIGGIGLIMSRIIPIGGLFIVFMHFQACTLYYVGFLEKFHTWNNQFDHWKYYSGGIEAATQEDAYIWLLTQAIGNTFSMNFKPETMSEQVVNIAFIVFGAILYALLVGLLSSAAIAYDSSGRLYRQKIDELNEYLNWKRIDPATKKKVLSYYEFKYRGKYFEEQTLLADMNNSLRMELASINCRRLIEKVPFLKREMKDGRDSIYLGKMATALHAVYYIPGDFVFHQGENAMEMFFIQTGKVSIIVNGKVVAFGNAGSFFGEVALIANIPRTASIQAAAACTLYSLSSRDFVAIINEFEDMKERIDLIYQDRMEKVRKEKEGKLKVLK